MGALKNLLIIADETGRDYEDVLNDILTQEPSEADLRDLLAPHGYDVQISDASGWRGYPNICWDVCHNNFDGPEDHWTPRLHGAPIQKVLELVTLCQSGQNPADSDDEDIHFEWACGS